MRITIQLMAKVPQHLAQRTAGYLGKGTKVRPVLFGCAAARGYGEEIGI